MHQNVSTLVATVLSVVWRSSAPDETSPGDYLDSDPA